MLKILFSPILEFEPFRRASRSLQQSCQWLSRQGPNYLERIEDKERLSFAHKQIDKIQEFYNVRALLEMLFPGHQTKSYERVDSKLIFGEKLKLRRMVCFEILKICLPFFSFKTDKCYRFSRIDGKIN